MLVVRSRLSNAHNVPQFFPVLPSIRRLEGTKVSAYSVHPGGIQTNLQRHMPFLLSWILGKVLALLTWLQVSGAKTIPQVGSGLLRFAFASWKSTVSDRQSRAGPGKALLTVQTSLLLCRRCLHHFRQHVGVLR